MRSNHGSQIFSQCIMEEKVIGDRKTCIDSLRAVFNLSLFSWSVLGVPWMMNQL